MELPIDRAEEREATTEGPRTLTSACQPTSGDERVGTRIWQRSSSETSSVAETVFDHHRTELGSAAPRSRFSTRRRAVANLPPIPETSGKGRSTSRSDSYNRRFFCFSRGFHSTERRRMGAFLFVSDVVHPVEVEHGRQFVCSRAGDQSQLYRRSAPDTYRSPRRG